MKKSVLTLLVHTHVLTGRSQAGLCAHDGKLMAVGGGDSWQCLSSVERYDPSDNKWTYLPSMATARRGAGVVMFKGLSCVLLKAASSKNFAAILSGVPTDF